MTRARVSTGHPARQCHELTANRSDRLSIVHAEVGDNLEIWCEPTRQPHQLYVPLGFTLKAAARL
jgi:hypothetical protein